MEEGLGVYCQSQMKVVVGVHALVAPSVPLNVRYLYRLQDWVSVPDLHSHQWIVGIRVLVAPSVLPNMHYLFQGVETMMWGPVPSFVVAVESSWLREE